MCFLEQGDHALSPSHPAAWQYVLQPIQSFAGQHLVHDFLERVLAKDVEFGICIARLLLWTGALETGNELKKLPMSASYQYKIHLGGRNLVD